MASFPELSWVKQKAAISIHITKIFLHIFSVKIEANDERRVTNLHTKIYSLLTFVSRAM